MKFAAPIASLQLVGLSKHETFSVGSSKNVQTIGIKKNIKAIAKRSDL